MIVLKEYFRGVENLDLWPIFEEENGRIILRTGENYMFSEENSDVKHSKTCIVSIFKN